MSGVSDFLLYKWDRRIGIAGSPIPSTTRFPFEVTAALSPPDVNANETADTGTPIDTREE
jgi:hypothetical protein